MSKSIDAGLNKRFSQYLKNKPLSWLLFRDQELFLGIKNRWISLGMGTQAETR